MVICAYPDGWSERSAVRQRLPRASWFLTSVFAAAAAISAAAAQGSNNSLFTPFNSDARKILEGSWYSCREPDGQYGERVYDHVVNGGGKFEVHLGPRREFAIFKGVQDEHRDHDSPDNLLKP